MININDIEKNLNLRIKLDDISIFGVLQDGYCTSVPIRFVFDKNFNEVIFQEIYNSTQSINKTIEYNNSAINDNYPLIPAKSFILGVDIASDPIIYDSLSGAIFYAGEVTFYEQVKILDSIQSLPSLLMNEPKFVPKIQKKTKKLTLKSVENILSSLDIVKNEILVNFLLSLEIGEINSKSFHYIRGGVLSDTFISDVYSEKKIIKTNSQNKNNIMYKDVLLFCESVGGFYIGLNLKDYSISLFIKENIRIFDDIPSFLNFLKK